MHQIILASQSPRRKLLLEWAEIEFGIFVEATDESYPEHLSPPEIAIHIAREKGRKIHYKFPGKTIIAADTIVVLENEIINKPYNRQDAIEMLTKLSGKHHKVMTGVVITRDDKEIAFTDITDVEFHSLSLSQIEYYVDKYKPYDKAGAYAIQEWIGVVGIKCVNGDFYNVMGLPVSRVVKSLREINPEILL